jgi:hypothetical protein
VLWIRNYFFRIRILIPFSAEFWIRIKKNVTDPDPTSKNVRIQFRIRPKHSLFHNANDFK